MYYIGFDLGDGESCLTLFDSCGTAIVPTVIPVGHADSFPTAVAVMSGTGDAVIGRNALTNAPTLEDLRVCFKRDFKSGSNDVYESFRRFVSGVMKQLDNAGLPFDFRDPQVCRFVVGQPADWDERTLERYRRLLENCGILDPCMVSESRAALVYVNTARFMEAYDPMSSAALVCDFGSSTLDFAYSPGGAEEKVTVFGDPRLGGGLMDEQIVLESIRRIREPAAREKAAELMQQRSDIRSRLMMGARKLKEQYFLDPDRQPLSLRIPIFDPELSAVSVCVDEQILNAVVMYPQAILSGNSLYEQLQEQLSRAKEITRENPPMVIVLTGGASRMDFFRNICEDVFRSTGAAVICSDTPELDIACGLALDGSYLEKLQRLKEELRSFADGQGVESIVSRAMPELSSRVADGIMEALLAENGPAPGVIRTAFRKWKNDHAAYCLEDLKTILEESVRQYSGSEEFNAVVEEAVSGWMASILARVQEELDAICLRVGVSPVHVRLKGGSFSESVEIGGGSFTPGTEIVKVLDVIVTTITAAIVAVLAGGDGLALLMAGPAGILIGLAAVGLLHIVVGDKLRSGFMKMPLLTAVRRMIPEATVFNEHSMEEMKQDMASQLARQELLQEQLCSGLSDHIDAVVRAISCQTKV